MRASHLALALLPVTLLACTKGDKDSDQPPGLGDDSEASCEGNDPVLANLLVEEGQPTDFEGVTYPTVLIQAEAADEDGNLDLVRITLYFDETVDGSIDTETAGSTSASVSPDGGGPCESINATLGLYLQVGEGIAYETEYDWGMQIEDSKGEVSNLLVGSGVTPAALPVDTGE
jgi:hypothetical protein